LVNENTLSNPSTISERVGLVIPGENAATAVKTIAEAEAAGVKQIWMTHSPYFPDSLTILAAAATKTSTIRLGTSIVPTYPRHPLVMAQQALSIHDIAPGRLRLGVGPSHQPIIEGIYGLRQETPLAHLREYVYILRTVLWEGKIDHHGKFFNVKLSLPRKAQIPILISTLGKKAFQLAGEIADGALSWVCPVEYLISSGIPALRTGAAAAATANRQSTPPLVAYISVALSEDRNAVLKAGRQMIDVYTKLPFYTQMFSDAGFPITAGQKIPDALIDSFLISGNEKTVASKFNKLLAKSGLDELMVNFVPIKDAKAEFMQIAHLIGKI
jgi:alkanesulfonate monooxygenase SsuD/methylene tetrahydromethanopterin reductase-like flavin-dependent oxidoreductase (luciferase family)